MNDLQAGTLNDWPQPAGGVRPKQLQQWVDQPKQNGHPTIIGHELVEDYGPAARPQNPCHFANAAYGVGDDRQERLWENQYLGAPPPQV